MFTLALQAMSRYIALTAMPKQPAPAPSFRRLQQPPGPAQARMRPQAGGKLSPHIDQEVQRIVQSVLGAAVASDLPLMQARCPVPCTTISDYWIGTLVNNCSALSSATWKQEGSLR